MEEIIQLNSGAKLSEHFTFGELTKSSSHPEIYNVPTHEAIANLKHVCEWLEVLRERYNRYLESIHPAPSPAPARGGEYGAQSTPLLLGGGARGGGDKTPSIPIIINSGYRSPQLNRAIGGVATSNHLTGCAVDIRVTGMEQLIRYAAILLDYADETHQDFDELLIERNRYGAIWLHFAVRFRGNRHKVLYINA